MPTTTTLPTPKFSYRRHENGRRIKVYRIAKPDRVRETKVEYNIYAPRRIAEVVGRVLSRNSFGKYHRDQLFPVKRGEVYIEMHTWTEQPTVCTTAEFMDRFCHTLRYARRQEDLE